MNTYLNLISDMEDKQSITELSKKTNSNYAWTYHIISMLCGKGYIRFNWQSNKRIIWITRKGMELKKAGDIVRRSLK